MVQVSHLLVVFLTGYPAETLRTAYDTHPSRLGIERRWRPLQLQRKRVTGGSQSLTRREYYGGVPHR
jgi:hypothetical protein